MTSGEELVRRGYSIAAVSKLTGISCHALRAWERRYGFPSPDRSPSGHRRYDAGQVETLRQAVIHLREGGSPARVLGTLKRTRESVREALAPKLDQVAELLDRLAVADLPGADALLNRLAGELTPGELAATVLERALVEAGERWFRGVLTVPQEHLATHFLRASLGKLVTEARRENLRPEGTVLLSTVQGERHEGGVLLLALHLELSGWRAICLGTDLPTATLQGSVARWRPDALALSFVLSRNINKRFREIAEIQGVPIVVGGRSILNYQKLARRYGLIPLPGSADQVIGPLAVEIGRGRRG